MFSDLFDEKNIELGIYAKNSIDFLKKVVPELKKNGYVNEEYLSGILEREKEFPTGLATKTYPIAIPHGFPENVIKPGIFVYKVNRPISFKQMGSSTEVVDVRMIFLLVIKDPKDQILILQNLVNKFMDKKEMDKLFSAKSSKELYVILKSWFYGSEEN